MLLRKINAAAGPGDEANKKTSLRPAQYECA
jgi:hypothetical protein